MKPDVRLVGLNVCAEVDTSPANDASKLLAREMSVAFAPGTLCCRKVSSSKVRARKMTACR
jgi:hypothetical protein